MWGKLRLKSAISRALHLKFSLWGMDFISHELYMLETIQSQSEDYKGMRTLHSEAFIMIQLYCRKATLKCKVGETPSHSPISAVAHEKTTCHSNPSKSAGSAYYTIKRLIISGELCYLQTQCNRTYNDYNRISIFLLVMNWEELQQYSIVVMENTSSTMTILCFSWFFFVFPVSSFSQQKNHIILLYSLNMHVHFNHNSVDWTESYDKHRRLTNQACRENNEWL